MVIVVGQDPFGSTIERQLIDGVWFERKSKIILGERGMSEWEEMVDVDVLSMFHCGKTKQRVVHFDSADIGAHSMREQS